MINYSCLHNDRYHNVFHLREDHTGILLNNDLEIHVMELTKLEEQAVPVSGGLVNWLLFLKGVDKPNWGVLTMNEPMLKKAMDTLEFLSQDAATRMEYESRMKYLRDEVSRMEGARSEGIVEGAVREKREMARKLLAMGHEVDFVVKLTELTEQEIKLLSKDVRSQ
ncbi:hypothetical protein B9T62_33070 [Paenibacillus donghaensis]|uniref:Rpn family recombination-promoting nuclease/putative transposase n=1 Tax=Paenibacillus donghaensis TaxID=414771 RepID=A0A2Z2KEF8_9BACL|nr:hypothetical protein B9T62_33070 [Paenibacillus donghaensis]